MSQKISLQTLNNGGIIEAADIALLRIADNIADVNTPAAKPRKLVLELVFTPDKNRTFTTAKATVKTTLQPDEPQEIALLLDQEEGISTLYEAYRDTNPNQHTLPGSLPGDLAADESKSPNVTPFRAATK